MMTGCYETHFLERFLTGKIISLTFSICIFHPLAQPLHRPHPNTINRKSPR